MPTNDEPIAATGTVPVDSRGKPADLPAERPNTPGSASGRFSLDAITKLWLPIIAGIYGSGYIVVSLYHATLGLNEISPLRPQIAAAGAFFLATLAAAFFTQELAFSIVRRLANGLTPWHAFLFKNCFGGMYLFSHDLVAAFFLAPLFHFDGRQDFAHAFPITAILAWLFLAAFLSLPWQGFIRKSSTHWIGMIVSGSLGASLLWMSLPLHGQFGIRQFGLYLFVVQMLSIPKLVRVPDFRRSQNWVSFAGRFLVPLIIYGTFVYPHVRAAFGGGQPITATITLSNPTNGLPVPGNMGEINVVDETDSGFYIIQGDTDGVQYIPRNRVYSVKFSKPSLWLFPY